MWIFPRTYFLGLISIDIFSLFLMALVGTALMIIFSLWMKIKKLKENLSQNNPTASPHLNPDLNQLIGERGRELKLMVDRLSHDVKGLLISVEELAHIALLENENDPTTNEYLRMQLELLDKMKLLIFRVLEIEQIRDHQIKKREIQLPSFFKSLKRSMKRVEGGKEALIAYPSDDLVLLSDETMLEIALDSLIRNAIEHNKNLDRSLKIDIQWQVQEQQLILSVQDNGQGIPPEVKENLFTLFILNTQKKLGFGLGLYKTKLAIEKQGGKVRLAETHSGKTRFEINLPFS